MKQLYLHVQSKQVACENVLDYNRKERNALLDAKKSAKKDKDTDTVDECNRKLLMVEENILHLEAKARQLADEFEEKKHELGKIRLNLYVFADVMYNTLLEYESFLNKHVINKHDDDDTIKAIRQGLDAFKKLPFEMGDGNDKTNELYNVITDKFLERWKTIRDGVVLEILREVDNKEKAKS